MADIKTGLDKLKEQYEGIHAPQELEGRLIEMESVYKRKARFAGLKSWGERAAVFVCCAVAGITLISNINASAAEAMQKIPIIGAVSKVVTFRSYKSGDADIKTPHVTGLGDKKTEQKLNKEFDKYSDAIIAQYEADVKDMGSDPHVAVSSSYKVLVDNSSQLTIVMNTVVAKGDSMETDWYYNIDKKTGKLLKLSDVFRSGTDYIKPINAYISGEINKNPDDYFMEDDKFKSIASDQNFYINKDGKLVLVFDEASIAPAYKGVIEFTVPTDIISGILPEDGLVH